MSRLLVLVLVAWGLASFAGAEPPAGAYAIDVSAIDGVVLPSGTLPEACVIDGPDGDVCISAEYDTDASGAIAGSAVLAVEDGGLALQAALALEGQMAGSALLPRATLELAGTGSATTPDPNDPDDPNLPPLEFDVEASGKLRCRLDLESLEQLNCKGKARLCVFDDQGVKRGCENVRLAVPLDFESVPFQVQLDLATSESGVVSGEGAVAIDAVPAFTYTAAGRHKASSDTTNLKLTSTDPLVNTWVRLKKTLLAGGEATGGVMLFRIAGQKGRVELPAATIAKGLAPCIRGSFCDVNDDTAELFTGR